MIVSFVKKYGRSLLPTCDYKEESSPDSHWSQIIGSSMFGRESIRVTEADPSNRTAGE